MGKCTSLGNLGKIDSIPFRHSKQAQAMDCAFRACVRAGGGGNGGGGNGGGGANCTPVHPGPRRPASAYTCASPKIFLVFSVSAGRPPKIW